MTFQSLVITGGAGFVGSNLAVSFRRRSPDRKVTVIDSLKRRGSELALSRLRQAGVEFIHGDIRCPDDLAALPEFDLMIDCSAEPSVQAGQHGSPHQVLDINLTGTIHCLEAARRNRAAFLFLSTSRVYPIGPLNSLPCREDETRFRWDPSGSCPRGFSEHGIAEDFPLEGARSFYGASKLSCRASYSGIRPFLWNGGDHQPLRRPGRALADGQGRPGGRDALGGPACIPDQPTSRYLLASAAEASRCEMSCTATTSSS